MRRGACGAGWQWRRRDGRGAAARHLGRRGQGRAGPSGNCPGGGANATTCIASSDRRGGAQYGRGGIADAGGRCGARCAPRLQPRWPAARARGGPHPGGQCARNPILALDLPSGLDPDSGVPHDPTIRATSTLALALPKVGLLRPEAATSVGELWLADISVPARAYAGLGIALGPLFAESDLIHIARS
jgi:hypothetical protein